MLSNTDVIPGLHANLFSMTLAQQKGYQATSEGEYLILKKISTKIRFDEKMANKSSKGFLLTTKFYKSANYATSLASKKQNWEGKAYIKLE